MWDCKKDIVGNKWFPTAFGVVINKCVDMVGNSIGKVIRWVLNLTGTQYMELSVSKTFTGDFDFEFVVSKTNSVSSMILGVQGSGINYTFINSVGAVRMNIAGVSIDSSASAFPFDGLEHIIRVVRTGSVIEIFLDSVSIATGTSAATYPVDLVGAYNGPSLRFQGIIYSVALTDLVTSSNSIAWNIDSGPDTGTVYQDSETYGTGADIGVEVTIADLGSEQIVASGQHYLGPHPTLTYTDDRVTAQPFTNGALIVGATTLNNNTGSSITYTPQINSVPEALIMINTVAGDWSQS